MQGKKINIKEKKNYKHKEIKKTNKMKERKKERKKGLCREKK